MTPPPQQKSRLRGLGTLGLHLDGDRNGLKRPAKRARCPGSHTDLLPLEDGF